MLREIHQDMEIIELPSWISPAPSKVGEKKHGKLSADQWRTFCTVHLPITLIRLWGGLPEGQRERRMLANFMDLVTAVEISGSLVISGAHIDLYCSTILRYLRTMKSLYKEAKVVPNHHMSVHIGDSVLPHFGPLHAIRAFHTERFNFLLQNENTNGKLGTSDM